MATARVKGWSDLDTFLELVEKGDVPSALEDAQAAALADPKKAKAREKRVAERNRVVELHDMDAYVRLSKEGYRLRKAFQVKRAEARKTKAAAQKVLAIQLVRRLYKLMMNHPDGWTLMLGMPSVALLADIRELDGSEASMMSSVSAEVRRFQRAVGMTTWEIITAHNRGILPQDGTREGALRNWMAGGLGVGDAAPLVAPLAAPTGQRGRIFKQTQIMSYKLLPDDSDALMDAMEYEQDVWAAEAAAVDRELLATHPAPLPGGGHLARGQSGSPASPGVWVMNSGVAMLRASLAEAALVQGKVVLNPPKRLKSLLKGALVTTASGSPPPGGPSLGGKGPAKSVKPRKGKGLIPWVEAVIPRDEVDAGLGLVVTDLTVVNHGTALTPTELGCDPPLREVTEWRDGRRLQPGRQAKQTAALLVGGLSQVAGGKRPLGRLLSAVPLVLTDAYVWRTPDPRTLGDGSEFRAPPAPARVPCTKKFKKLIVVAQNLVELELNLSVAVPLETLVATETVMVVGEAPLDQGGDPDGPQVTDLVSADLAEGMEATFCPRVPQLTVLNDPTALTEGLAQRRREARARRKAAKLTVPSGGELMGAIPLPLVGGYPFCDRVVT